MTDEYVLLLVFAEVSRKQPPCSLLLHMAAGAYVRQSAEQADSGQNGRSAGQDALDEPARLAAPGLRQV